ncbi:MAG TPA: D-hexose-6-phosphate mutarotase [Terriglobales bacterium]|nr:D-hexose-6-phosphate mutarotase [Terriglobales bacterium]
MPQLMEHTGLTIKELNSRLGIPGRAQVLADDAGLPEVRVTAPLCDGEMHLHGAQVTSWKPADAEEAIFLSRQARWEEGKAIRGGIPICFPWFRAKADDSHAPAHGVVRTKIWTLDSIEQNGNGVTISMSTQSDPDTQRWWPADFRLLYRVTFGSELKLELTVTNTGVKPFRFEEALHTYYKVGDVRKVRVRGLDGVTYLDNTDSNKKKKQNGDVVISSPTDNAYMNTQNPLQLIDPVLNRTVQVTKQNSDSTVIWNPWAEGARALSDLGDDEWQDMVCVEGGNILENAVELAPSADHGITVTMTVAPLTSAA